MTAEVDIAIVGAGQAGLSAAYFARRAGLEPDTGFAVFDHSPRAGGAWQFRWPSLTFTTVHGIYQLPGMKLAAQELTTPVAEAVPRYFAAYESGFDLRVRRPVDVRRVAARDDGRLDVVTDAGSWIARGLVNATGTWDKPFWPRYPGAGDFGGRQLHTADYRGAHEFAGQRVVIVGGGASAIQHLLEIVQVAEVTWVTRRQPEFTDRVFDARWGREVVAAVDERVRRGLPPESVVKATKYPLTPAVVAARDAGLLNRRPMFDRLTPTGVAWANGATVTADVVLWATGFRAALDHLAPLRLREPGGGITMDGTRVVADPRVHLVGYGPSASTIGANRAGRTAIRELRDRLALTRPRPVNA